MAEPAALPDSPPVRRPSPEPAEAAAIVAAIAMLWQESAAAEPRGGRRPAVWKFSGRWWSQPLPLRRARPWT